VRWEVRSLQGFADVPLHDLAENYDLLVIDHPHIPVASEQGLLLPLDGTGHDGELATLADQSVGGSHASYAHGGHHYGLAIDAAAQVAVHRPDLLPTPPTSWPEVLELARAGLVLWPAKPVDAISSLLTLSANAGHPAGTSVDHFLDRETALSALSLMRELAELTPREGLAQNPIEVAELLSTSDEWAYAPLAFGYTNYSREGFREHRLAYVDIPEGVRGVRGSCLGGAGIAVSARTPSPEAAVEHAFWLAAAETQRGVYFDSGGQPGNAVAWDDDRLNAQTLDFFRGTRRTLEGAWTRPRSVGWLRVQDEVGTMVNAVLAGRLDEEEFLVRADESYLLAMDEAGS
jgi:multiple sugar transport system substrate-binding protein